MAGWWWPAAWSLLFAFGGERSDFGGVVGEDSPAAPGAGTGLGVVEGAAPPVVAFETRDTRFGSCTPLHQVPEPARAFGCLARRARSALAWDHDPFDTKSLEVGVDGRFTVSTIRDDRARCAPEPGDDTADRENELRRVGRVAFVDLMVNDDAVNVVDDLGLVTIMPMSA